MFSYLTLFYIKCPKIDLQYKIFNLCKICLEFYNKYENTNVKRSIQFKVIYSTESYWKVSIANV